MEVSDYTKIYDNYFTKTRDTFKIHKTFPIHVKTLTGQLLHLTITSSTTVLMIKEMLKKMKCYFQV